MKPAASSRLAELAFVAVLAAAAWLWVGRVLLQHLPRHPHSSGAPPFSVVSHPPDTRVVTPAAEPASTGHTPGPPPVRASLARDWIVSLLLVAGVSALLTAAVYRRRMRPLRTQLSESRTHLERQEKLASLGVLAAGIAHEIRNPLTAINVRLFSLKRSVPHTSSVQEDVQVITHEIQRLERIVGEFLQFARPPAIHLERLRLGDLLQAVRALLAPQLARRSVELVLEPAPEVWAAADPEKLKQVVINLVQNAAQSIPGRGSVTLRLSQARRPLGTRTADTAVIEVSDTGSGMPPEVVRRLFDPFFTTKEDGTGLGLPIAARIIEAHGGIIEYDTEPGSGTTFRIVVPRENHHEEPTAHPVD